MASRAGPSGPSFIAAPPKEGPAILYLDIETSFIVAGVWGLWDQNVGLNQIAEEWSILSYAYAWEGNPEVFVNHTGGRGPAKVRDDRALCEGLHALLDAADIVIGQNSVSFDIKKVNARMLMHGMKPYSPIRQIDTKLIAKKYFNFTSNKLAWMTQHLTSTVKSEHKKFPGFELWTECLKDNPEAWAEMASYNAIDVRSTRELYLRLRPWVDQHPNVAAYTGQPDACPKCGGTHLQFRGTAMTNTAQYRRMQCMYCGGWSRTRKNELTKETRGGLLGN